MRCKSCESRSWKVRLIFLAAVAMLVISLLAVFHWSWVHTVAFGVALGLPALFVSLLLIDLVIDAVPFWSKCAPHRG